MASRDHSGCDLKINKTNQQHVNEKGQSAHSKELELEFLMQINIHVRERLFLGTLLGVGPLHLSSELEGRLNIKDFFIPVFSAIQFFIFVSCTYRCPAHRDQKCHV